MGASSETDSSAPCAAQSEKFNSIKIKKNLISIWAPKCTKKVYKSLYGLIFDKNSQSQTQIKKPESPFENPGFQKINLA